MISIIIPTYNRLNLLKSLLDSIRRQSYQDYEVIVVDDASTDGTYEYIHHKYSEVHIYRFRRRCGPTHAKNIGVLQSKGEYLLFLDSDVEFLDNTALGRYVQIIQREKGCGQLGGEGFYRDAKKVFVYGRKMKTADRIDTDYIETNEKEKQRYCDYIPTSNCFILREAFLKVGGFDPRFIYPGEDIDLGIRLKKAGYQNIVHYDVGVLHRFSKTSRIRRSFSFYRAQTIFTIKYFGFGGILMNPLRDILDEYIPRIRGFTQRRFKRRLNYFSPEKTKSLDIPGEKSFWDTAVYMLRLPFDLILAYFWCFGHMGTICAPQVSHINQSREYVVKRNVLLD